MSPASTVAIPLRIPLFRSRGLVAILLIYATLGITVAYPLLAVLTQSFSEGAGLSVAKIEEVFTTPNIIDAVVNTLMISVFTVVFAGTVGVTLAWLVARSNMPFRRLFDPLNMVPFYLSSAANTS